MAKYREQMRKFYFDPTKYKTLLEQLGIKYPTVTIGMLRPYRSRLPVVTRHRVRRRVGAGHRRRGNRRGEQRLDGHGHSRGRERHSDRAAVQRAGPDRGPRDARHASHPDRRRCDDWAWRDRPRLHHRGSRADRDGRHRVERRGRRRGLDCGGRDPGDGRSAHPAALARDGQPRQGPARARRRGGRVHSGVRGELRAVRLDYM